MNVKDSCRMVQKGDGTYLEHENCAIKTKDGDDYVPCGRGRRLDFPDVSVQAPGGLATEEARRVKWRFWSYVGPYRHNKSTHTDNG